MKKYIAVFKTSWQNVLTYRFNFFVGQARNIVMLLLMYYIWFSLSFKTGGFAGYSMIELTTYVFLAAFLKPIIMGAQTRKISEEINDGTFSKYLAMPINYPLFVFFREFAERSLYFTAALIEVIIFAVILKANIFFQSNGKYLFVFGISLILANFLYFILTFCVSLLAFWSREAHGPRFLFEWILEFTSGIFYPLDIIFPMLFLILTFLPFAYILFYPIMIYLGRVSLGEIVKILCLQVSWIVAIAAFTGFVWKKGLRKYSGEGI